MSAREPGESPLVELRRVGRRFGDVEVLKPTDLAIARGDYLAITGPSGSGKSTLLNQIGLLDRPSTGQVMVAGRCVDDLPDDARSAIRGNTVGFVFQAFHLLANRTALENVELGMLYRAIPPAERRARAREALARVGLDHRMDASPTTLSGGERQRVAIARALASEVTLLVADEPTGNLDSTTGARVLDLFDELHAEGMALVVVTHSAEVSLRAARPLVMADGRLGEAT